MGGESERMRLDRKSFLNFLILPIITGIHEKSPINTCDYYG